jgi:uncharacterized protein DUF1566
MIILTFLVFLSGLAFQAPAQTHKEDRPLPGSNVAGVPRTGLSKCYDDTGTEILCWGTRQDGELQKGVAWPIPRFTPGLDGTVKDNLTGLIWLKDAGCMGGFEGANAGRTLADALLAVKDLNYGVEYNCAQYVAGTFNDWRLPNLKELLSLVDYSCYNPAIPNTDATGKWGPSEPFVRINAVEIPFWSSTSQASDLSMAWAFNAFSGGVLSVPKTEERLVWPVRGRQY